VVAGGHLAPEFGLAAGFDRYASGHDFGSFQQTVPLALDRLDAIADADAPWLLFVHGYDVHAPYVSWGPLFGEAVPNYDGPLRDASLVPWTCEQILGRTLYPGFVPELVSRGDRKVLDPALFRSLEAWATAHPEDAVPLDDEDVAFLRGRYDGAVRAADFHVGVLVDALADRGLAQSTIVVVLSDHGEDLLEHGHVNHRLSLHDENVHVPLLLRVPGQPPSVVPEPVSLVDVLPTLGALSGVDVQEGDGIDLRQPDPARAVYSEAVGGDVAVRTRNGRLSVPAAALAADSLPATPPSGAFATGADGDPMDWNDPQVTELFAALRAAAP
jgi:arylsulfatase A-like enzyme